MAPLTAIGLVVALASSAVAGGNPDARVFVDFEPGEYVHQCTPEPYEVVEAYVCIDRLDEGFTSVSLRMENLVEQYPEVFGAATWTHLLPCSDPPTESPWDEYGVFALSDQCNQSDPAIIGSVSFLYLGGSACIKLLDHGLCPYWVVDCSNERELDHYCVLAHGSVGGSVCPDGDCGGTPVAERSWGTIKGLFR